MRPRHTARERSITDGRSPGASKPVLGSDQPGILRCSILRALELRKPHREVFFLRDIQGHTLEEIAAILGISLETARVQSMRARCEMGRRGDSDAMERAR
jgi:Sigma-70, region 4